MAPDRVVQRVLHGQCVAVKVYPAQRSPVPAGGKLCRGIALTVDLTAAEDPMTDATRKSLLNPSPARHRLVG